MTESCLFCQEYAAGQDTFMENELFRARWDAIPVALGHAEVLPKRHVQYFHDLTSEEKANLLLFVDEVMKKIQRADLVAEYDKLVDETTEMARPYVQKAYEAATRGVASIDGFSHGINDGAAAGQTIPHLHYHIIPRRQGDVANPRGGIRRIFGEDDYSNGR